MALGSNTREYQIEKLFLHFKINNEWKFILVHNTWYYRYSSIRVANCINGNARKLPHSSPKYNASVIVSDALSCKDVVVPTSWGDHIKEVETKSPFVIAKSSCTDRENMSLRITILLSLPVVVRHMRNSGTNAIRSIAQATSFREKFLIRSTGIYSASIRPIKSPTLKRTKLKGTYRSLYRRIWFSHSWLLFKSDI